MLSLVLFQLGHQSLGLLQIGSVESFLKTPVHGSDQMPCRLVSPLIAQHRPLALCRKVGDDDRKTAALFRGPACQALLARVCNPPSLPPHNLR